MNNNNAAAPGAGKAAMSRPLTRLVVLGLVGANLLLCLLSSYLLYRSRQQYERHAQIQTQNVTKALDLNVSKSIATVDLALQAVVDDLQAQLGAGGLKAATTQAVLTKYEQRVPAIEAIRVARADGLVVFGRGLQMQELPSWADRPDFIYHQEHADSGLQVTEARMGRVAKKYIIALTRRYNHPDGSFAGVVAAPVAVDYFTQLLSQFDIGAKGTLILRDDQQRLITRVPALPNNPAGEVGNQVMSKDFHQVFDAGPDTATGVTSASPDGYRRIFTFQRIRGAHMVAIVAAADVDYLAGWRAELHSAAAVMGGFLVLSLLLGTATLRLLRRAAQDAQRLRDEQAFVTTILDSLTSHVAVIDAKGVITTVNKAWRDFAMVNGVANLAPVSVGCNYLDTCLNAVGTPEDGDALAVLQGIQAVLCGAQPDFIMEYPCHSPNEQRWFILHAAHLTGANQGAVLLHQNVTERHKAEARLKASEERFRQLFDTSIDGIFLSAPDGRIFSANRAACDLLQRTEAEIVQIGRNGVVDLSYPALAQSLEDRQRQGMFANELMFVRKDGSKFLCDVSSSIYKNSEGEALASVVFRDITERKRFEAQIHELAFHDALTRLPNRRLLSDRLQLTMAASKRSGLHGALMFIDLDNFKPLNDSHGHEVGDSLLVEVAQRLTGCVREIDTVARVGGDEFVVVLSELGTDAAASRQQARAVAEKIREALSAPYQLTLAQTGGSLQHRCTASIGVALFGADAGTPPDILKWADSAMYRAKHAGRNTIRCHAANGLS